MKKESKYKTERYRAVVESGNWSPECELNCRRFEERENCGHLHKTIRAAEECLKKHLGGHVVNGNYQWLVQWQNGRIHNQDVERVAK